MWVYEIWKIISISFYLTFWELGLYDDDDQEGWHEKNSLYSIYMSMGYKNRLIAQYHIFHHTSWLTLNTTCTFQGGVLSHVHFHFVSYHIYFYVWTQEKSTDDAVSHQAITQAPETTLQHHTWNSKGHWEGQTAHWQVRATFSCDSYMSTQWPEKQNEDNDVISLFLLFNQQSIYTLCQ